MRQRKFANDFIPEGCVIPETLDYIKVGVTVYKVYPPKNGGMVVHGVVTRAPYYNGKSLWFDTAGKSGLLNGANSVTDAGIMHEPYNQNRLFLNRAQAEAYLKLEDKVGVVDSAGNWAELPTDVYELYFTNK
jgi:hypothetical protein